VLPFLTLLHAPLLGNDAPVWMRDGQVQSLGDLGRLLLGPHFIFFRPVCALSFVPGAYPGQEWLAHLVDYAALIGLLWVFQWVARRALDLSPGTAVLLALALGFHPVVEELMPYQARRGDLLATLFGLGYVGSVLRGRPAWSRLVWLGLALGSKEMAFLLPGAAWVHEVARRDGPWPRRLGRSCLAVLPEGCLVIAFLGLRFVSLGGLGGNQDAPDVDRPFLIPVDYLTGIVFPHVAGVLELWRAAGVVLAAAIGAALLRLLIWRWTPAAWLCITFLAEEAALYWFLDIWQSRRILLGTALLLLFFGAAIRRRGRTMALATAVIVVPWVALHLASRPWERLDLLARTAREYSDRLVALARTVPEESYCVVAGDLPVRWIVGPLERRPSFSSPARVSGRLDRPILRDTFMAKEVRSILLPDRRISFRPLLELHLTSVDARSRIEIVDEEPGVLRYRLVVRGMEVLPSPVVKSRLRTPLTPGHYELDLDDLCGRQESSYLFLSDLDGGDLRPLPGRVEIEVLREAADR
jgi:hypothetical protein